MSTTEHREDTAPPPSITWRTTLTVPNGLSLVRLVLGLCFPRLPLSWRLWIVVVAAITDMLDGSAARFFGVCSRVGRVLDPIADKVFVLGVLGTLLWEEQLSLGVLLLIGLRDVCVLVGTSMGLALRMWSAFRRLSPPLLAKATTAAQFGFVLVLLAAPDYRESALIVTVSLSALAGLQYLWLYGRECVQRSATKGEPPL